MPYAVPLKKAANHPIMVGIAFNPRMGRWDISVEVGNFSTEQEARDAAKGVSDAVADHFGTSLRKVVPGELDAKDN